jgi:hypothetical protein
MVRLSDPLAKTDVCNGSREERNGHNSEDDVVHIKVPESQMAIEERSKPL